MKHFFLFLAFSLSASSIAVADTEHSQRAEFFSRAEKFLSGMRETNYQHRTEIDEAAGIYRCDCSGMIVYLIKHDFPTSHASLSGEEAPWKKRPLAVTFYETFRRAEKEKVVGWEAISKLAEAKPGDILVWRKDKLVRGSSTGHVLIIASEPIEESDGRLRVEVIDSTRKIHAEDTREKGTDGVGKGTMWFDVDESGKAIRYYVDDSATPGKSTMIALGRLAR